MIDDLKVAIVVPLHIVPTDKWLEALEKEADYTKSTVIIVDDSPEQFLKRKLPIHWIVYNREDQQKILGDQYDAFKVFHKSSACRNFGNFIAWKQEFDVIIGLDSDCILGDDSVGMHIEALKMKGFGWTNPIKRLGWFPRGFPYAERNRKIVANLGLWSNVLDINAKDREKGEPTGVETGMSEYGVNNEVAQGFIPFSGMNWAMWRESMPGFLFLPNFNYQSDGETFKFRRHDDIWGGYIFQKLMEKRNERMTYGYPIVFHDTVIDKEADMKEEHGMIEFENFFYSAVDTVVDMIDQSSYEDMMAQFATIIETEWKDTEWEPLIKPIKFWASLFNGIHS